MEGQNVFRDNISTVSLKQLFENKYFPQQIHIIEVSLITHQEKTEPLQVMPAEAMEGTNLLQCCSSVLREIKSTSV